MDNNIIDISTLPQVEQDIGLIFHNALSTCLDAVTSEVENRLNLYTSFTELAAELVSNVCKADKIVPRDFMFGLPDWMMMYQDDFFMQIAGIPGIPYCSFSDDSRTYFYTIYSILFNAEDELPEEGVEADFGMTVLKTKINDPTYVEVWKTDGFWETVDMDPNALTFEDAFAQYEKNMSHLQKTIMYRDDLETTLLKALIIKYGRILSDEEYEKEREKYAELISEYYFDDCFFTTDGETIFLRGDIATYGFAIEPSERGYKLYQYLTPEDLVISDIIDEEKAENVQEYKRMVCEAKTLDEIISAFDNDSDDPDFNYDMIIPLGIDTAVYLEADDFNEATLRKRAKEQGGKLIENERNNLNALCAWIKKHVDPNRPN